MKLAKVFKENKQFTLFSILALVVVGVAVFAPQIAPYDPLDAVMLELASLSFLGFGATAPTPEWGLMLNEGRTYMAKAPWLMIYPGIAIVICVVIFNMLGDSIRDVLDPRQE